jgi:hypothetical protein
MKAIQSAKGYPPGHPDGRYWTTGSKALGVGVHDGLANSSRSRFYQRAGFPREPTIAVVVHVTVKITLFKCAIGAVLMPKYVSLLGRWAEKP